MEENKNIGMTVEEKDLDNVSGGVGSAEGAALCCPVCGSTSIKDNHHEYCECRSCGHKFVKETFSAEANFI